MATQRERLKTLYPHLSDEELRGVEKRLSRMRNASQISGLEESASSREAFAGYLTRLQTGSTPISSLVVPMSHGYRSLSSMDLSAEEFARYTPSKLQSLAEQRGDVTFGQLKSFQHDVRSALGTPEMANRYAYHVSSREDREGRWQTQFTSGLPGWAGDRYNRSDAGFSAPFENYHQTVMGQLQSKLKDSGIRFSIESTTLPQYRRGAADPGQGANEYDLIRFDRPDGSSGHVFVSPFSGMVGIMGEDNRSGIQAIMPKYGEHGLTTEGVGSRDDLISRIRSAQIDTLAGVIGSSFEQDGEIRFRSIHAGAQDAGGKYVNFGALTGAEESRYAYGIRMGAEDVNKVEPFGFTRRNASGEDAGFAYWVDAQLRQTSTPFAGDRALMPKAKRLQQTEVGGQLADVYAGPGLPMPRWEAPVRVNDQTTPEAGFRAISVYTLSKSFEAEGQIAGNAALMYGQTGRRLVTLAEGALQAGDLFLERGFSPDYMSEDTRYRGAMSDYADIVNRKASGRAVRIDNVEYVMGRDGTYTGKAWVTETRMYDDADLKTGGKKFNIRGVAADQLPEIWEDASGRLSLTPIEGARQLRADFVGALPGEGTIPSLAMNSLLATHRTADALFEDVITKSLSMAAAARAGNLGGFAGAYEETRARYAGMGFDITSREGLEALYGLNTPQTVPVAVPQSSTLTGDEVADTLSGLIQSQGLSGVETQLRDIMQQQSVDAAAARRILAQRSLQPTSQQSLTPEAAAGRVLDRGSDLASLSWSFENLGPNVEFQILERRRALTPQALENDMRARIAEGYRARYGAQQPDKVERLTQRLDQMSFDEVWQEFHSLSPSNRNAYNRIGNGLARISDVQFLDQYGQIDPSLKPSQATQILATTREEAIVARTLEQPKIQSSRPNDLIGIETLDWMSYRHPELVDAMMTAAERSPERFNNAAAGLLTAHRTQVIRETHNEDYRRDTNVTFDPDLYRQVEAEARARLVDDSGMVDSDKVAVEAMRLYGRATGNQMIDIPRIGGSTAYTVGMGGNDAAAYASTDNPGQVAPGLAQARLMAASARLTQNPTEEEQAELDILHEDYLQAMGSQELDKNGRPMGMAYQPNVVREGFGIKRGRMGGIGKALESLPAGQVMGSAKYVAEQTGLTMGDLAVGSGLYSDSQIETLVKKGLVRQEDVDAARAANIQSAFSTGIGRHPHSDINVFGMPLSTRFQEFDAALNLPTGAELNPGRNFYTSKWNVMPLMGDFDADRYQFYPNLFRDSTGMLIGKGIEKADWQAIEHASLGINSELIKYREDVAGRINRGLIADNIGAAYLKGMTPQALAEQNNLGEAGRKSVGATFNNFLRLGQKAMLETLREQYGVNSPILRSMGDNQLGVAMTQLKLDLDEQSASMDSLERIAAGLNQTSSGKYRVGWGDKAEDLGNYEQMASRVMSDLAQLFNDPENPQAFDLSKPDQLKAAKSIAFSLIPGDVAAQRAEAGTLDALQMEIIENVLQPVRTNPALWDKKKDLLPEMIGLTKNDWSAYVRGVEGDPVSIPMGLYQTIARTTARGKQIFDDAAMERTREATSYADKYLKFMVKAGDSPESIKASVEDAGPLQTIIHELKGGTSAALNRQIERFGGILPPRTRKTLEEQADDAVNAEKASMAKSFWQMQERHGFEVPDYRNMSTEQILAHPAMPTIEGGAWEEQIRSEILGTGGGAPAGGSGAGSAGGSGGSGGSTIEAQAAGAAGGGSGGNDPIPVRSVRRAEASWMHMNAAEMQRLMQEPITPESARKIRAAAKQVQSIYGTHKARQMYVDKTGKVLDTDIETAAYMGTELGNGKTIAGNAGDALSMFDARADEINYNAMLPVPKQPKPGAPITSRQAAEFDAASRSMINLHDEVSKLVGTFKELRDSSDKVVTVTQEQYKMLQQYNDAANKVQQILPKIAAAEPGIEDPALRKQYADRRSVGEMLTEGDVATTNQSAAQNEWEIQNTDAFQVLKGRDDKWMALFDTSKKGAKDRAQMMASGQFGDMFGMFSDIMGKGAAGRLAQGIGFAGRAFEGYAGLTTSFMLNRGSAMVGNVMQDARRYEDHQATLALTGYQAGLISEQALIEGSYGHVMQRTGDAAMAAHYRVQAAYNAYGGVVGLRDSLYANNPGFAQAGSMLEMSAGVGVQAGALGGIIGTATGAGFWGGAAMLGLPAMGLALAAGVMGTVHSNRDNYIGLERGDFGAYLSYNMGGFSGKRYTGDPTDKNAMAKADAGYVMEELSKLNYIDDMVADVKAGGSISAQLDQTVFWGVEREDINKTTGYNFSMLGQQATGMLFQRGNLYIEVGDFKGYAPSVAARTGDTQLGTTFIEALREDYKQTLTSAGVLGSEPSEADIASAMDFANQQMFYTDTLSSEDALKIFRVGRGNFENTLGAVSSFGRPAMFASLDDRKAMWGEALGLMGDAGTDIGLAADRGVRSEQIGAAVTAYAESNQYRRLLGLDEMSTTEAAKKAVAYNGELDRPVMFDMAQLDFYNTPYGHLDPASDPLLRAAGGVMNTDPRKFLRLLAQPDATSFAANASFRGGTNGANEFNNLRGYQAVIGGDENFSALGPGFTEYAIGTLGDTSASARSGNIFKQAMSLTQLADEYVWGVDRRQVAMARAAAETGFWTKESYQREIDQLETNPETTDQLLAETQSSGHVLSINSLRRQRGADILPEGTAFNDSVVADLALAAEDFKTSAKLMSDTFSKRFKESGMESTIDAMIEDPAMAPYVSRGMQYMTSAAANRAGWVARGGNAAAIDTAIFGSFAVGAISPETMDRAMLVGQGDQYAIGQSYMAGNTALAPYMTVDPTTGGQLGRTGLPQGAQFAPLRHQFFKGLTQAFNQLGMPDDVRMTAYSYFQEGGGGTLAMQGDIFNLQRQAAQISAGHQIASTRLRMAFQMGGATGVDSQGFAVGGDLTALQGMVERQGFTFTPGNGMGMWQVEDAQTLLRREQQDFQLAQQGRGLAIQGQDRALQIAQFNERWNANYSWFQRQTAQSRWSMNFGRQTQLEQREWSREDMAFNEAQANLQFAWQQEDFSRNIRYARGRERLDLQRQQSRANIQFAMEQTQRERGEERFEKQAEWEDKRFEKEKKFFEASTKHQDEMMKMDKRHFEERMKLSDEQFAMQLEAFEKQKEWIIEERALEDQSRLLQRQQYMVLETMGLRASGAIAGINDEITKIQGGLQGTQVAAENTAIQLNNAVINGGLFVLEMAAVMGTAEEIKNDMSVTQVDLGLAVQHIERIAKIINGITPPKGYASGGYTGDGPKNEVAGVVHKGEYVVPQEGALVLRESRSSANSARAAEAFGGIDYSSKFDRLIELFERQPQLIEAVRLLNRIAAKGGGVKANIYTSTKDVSIAELERSARQFVR